MNAVQTASNLKTVIRQFSEANKSRPTRMGVFEQGNGAVIDYWLEDFMPLAGVDVELHDNTASIQIFLEQKEGSEESHYTHSVNNMLEARIILTVTGESDGLEILDSEGRTTILRFEM